MCSLPPLNFLYLLCIQVYDLYDASLIKVQVLLLCIIYVYFETYWNFETLNSWFGQYHFSLNIYIHIFCPALVHIISYVHNIKTLLANYYISTIWIFYTCIILNNYQQSLTSENVMKVTICKNIHCHYYGLSDTFQNSCFQIYKFSPSNILQREYLSNGK